MDAAKKVEEDFFAVNEVLSKPKYLAGFLAAFLVIGFVYAVLTGIFLIFTLEINQKLDILNLFLIIMIALVSALTLTLTIYKLKQNRRLGTGEKTGLFGSLLGTFTTACPVCQPIWLVWLGLGNASVFLVEISTYIALASIALLLLALHLAAKSVYAKTCKI